MKYAIIYRDDSYTLGIVNEIRSKLTLEEDLINPDIVITVGGDGTILSAVHKYIDKLSKTIFFGLNTGHLGFYTNFEPKELDKMIEKINSFDFEIESYHLLEYNHDKKTDYALNEITLLSNYVQEIDVFLDGKLLENFRGTGLCISTPSGSTAYNKSLGGPVVDSFMDAVILTEIASINSNAYRTVGSSLVIASNRELTLVSKKEANLTVDSMHYEIKPSVIKARLSDKSVKFARIHDITFWDRVKKSFI